MSIRTLRADSQGLAYWMEREAKAMPDGQILRELVVNGAEAGATKIIIDGWTDPLTSKTLLRVSDNGSGMTDEQLVDYLSTLHVQSGKGAKNHGVGARISAVPKNPAGVTFASRSTNTEAMVRIVKDHGQYGLKQWPVEIDGFDQLAEVVLPDAGEIDRVGAGTGTAVILHGNGRSDTWTASSSYTAQKYLSERFYAFPGGATVSVHRYHENRSAAIKPFGQVLADNALADGEIAFKDIAGLNGVMFWWVLPTTRERGGIVKSTGGIGTVIDDEIFDYSTTYSADFGLIYGSVAKRVAILIWIDDAAMDTGRAGIVLPGARKSVPWKKLGQHFAAHMPAEIDDLLSRVTVSSQEFDSELAKLLDEEWMKKLDPVPVPVPADEGENLTGEDEGDATPEGEELELEPSDSHPTPEPQRRKAVRQQGGDKAGKTKPKVVTPAVVFLAPEEMADGHEHITYISSQNQLQVSLEFPPYIREIGRWVEQTGHPETLVKAAVQRAYQAEFAATIIDANAQARHGLAPDLIEELKSDAALYTKALGFQALSERIAGFIKQTVKAA